MLSDKSSSVVLTLILSLEFLFDTLVFIRLGAMFHNIIINDFDKDSNITT